MAVAKSDGVIRTKPGRKVTRFEDGSKRIVKMGRHGVKGVKIVHNGPNDGLPRKTKPSRPSTKAQTAGPLRMGRK